MGLSLLRLSLKICLLQPLNEQLPRFTLTTGTQELPEVCLVANGHASWLLLLLGMSKTAEVLCHSPRQLWPSLSDRAGT